MSVGSISGKVEYYERQLVAMAIFPPFDSPDSRSVHVAGCRVATAVALAALSTLPVIGPTAPTEGLSISVASSLAAYTHRVTRMPVERMLGIFVTGVCAALDLDEVQVLESTAARLIVNADELRRNRSEAS